MNAGGFALANRMARIGGSTKRAELLLGHLISAEGGHFIAGGVEPYLAAIGELDACGLEVAVASLVAKRISDPELFAALTCGASHSGAASGKDHAPLRRVGPSDTDACVTLIMAVSVPFGATTWIFFSSCPPEQLIGPGLPADAPTDAPFGFTLDIASRHRNTHHTSALISEPYPLDVNIPSAVWRAVDRLAFTLGRWQEQATNERSDFVDRLHEGAFRRAATSDELAWIALGLCRRYAIGDALSLRAKKDRDISTLGT